MKSRLISTAVFLFVLTFGFQAVLAQITITIPKIPKITKDKKEKPKTTDNSQTNDNRTNDSQTNSNQSDNQSQNNQAKEDSKPQEVTDECETNSIAGLATDEIAKMTEDIDGYTPARGWLYSGYPTYKYLLFAVSPSAKEKWQNDFKEIGNCPKIVSGLEKLSAAAAKKLPLYVPNTKEYGFHNAAEERLIKGKINDLADHKIHYIGIKQASWLIEKNEFGIPKSRYKHGMVWVRYMPNDHPYCRIYYINIIQDYAGGGTYGASYGYFVSDVLAGCPAGK